MQFGLFDFHGEQRDVERFTHFIFDLDGQFAIFAQEFACVVTALPDFFALVGVPRTGLVDDLGSHAHVDDFSVAADAFAKQNIEFSGFEGWRHFVFHHFDFGLVADGLFAFFDGAGAANV